MPSFTDAIETKYASDNFCDNGPGDGSFVILTPKSIPIPITADGDVNCSPSVLILDHCNIDVAGDLQKLQNICAKVHELDLSHNLLSSWDEVIQILNRIPSLEFLNLSYNPLAQEICNFSATKDFPQLKTLVLIGTNIGWNSLWSLLRKFQNLKELHLSLNGLSEIISPNCEDKFLAVEKLMFDGNPVSEWSQIEELGQIFPSLKHLSVANCPLRLIANSADFSEIFANLEVINLSSTLIETEEEILRLNDFQRLRQVRITGIPFLDKVEAKQKRQELIALLPNIQKLNGGADISQEERDGAERYYIRKFLNIEDKPPRYFDLVQKHGELLPLADINLKPVTKITLKIKFGQEQEIDQEVNLRQSVKEFKKSLEPIIGLPSSRMTLYHVDVGLEGYEILRFPDKMLYTYNMRSGDEIHVEIKNSGAKDKDNSKKLG